VLTLAAAASAQFKAGVQGTVTDATGAILPGASVTLTSNETNKAETTTASEEGFYRFSGLAPGSYTLSVEQAGFKKQLLNDVVINAEQVRGVDIKLEAGGISETITVTSDELPALETENASISKAITTQEIRKLPQIGRDPYELLRLTPGIFGSGARGFGGGSIGLPNTTGPGGSNSSIFQTENQVPISANGQRVSNNNYQVDGVSVNSLQFGGAAVVTPNQEAVKEVRVSSSAYTAELGRNSGAQVEVVSQNGTNDFHGSAFFKYNDPNLNAFNKYGGINNLAPQRVNNRFRQYGGSLGGPIFHDKLFFFFSYEGLRNKSADSFTEFVETPQFRQLVASARPNSVTARIFNSAGIEPRITSVIPTDCSRYGNDPARCRVVAGGLDIGSLAGAQNQYISYGNPIGGGFDGVPDIQLAEISLPSSTRGNQFNPRFDYTRGANQFTFSSFFTKRTDVGSDRGARSRPSADVTNKPLNSAVTLAFIRTFSASLINEARFSFTRFSSDQVAASADTNFGIPRVEVEGLPFDRIRFGAPQASTTPAIFAQNTFEFRNTIRKVFGSHALSIGGQIRREQDNNNLGGRSRPLFSFVGLFNLANDAPIFYQLSADPRTGGPADTQRYFRTGDSALFIQDDWKFRPNLTFNLGLRYEYFSPLSEKDGRLSNAEFGSNGLLNARVVTTDELFEPDRNNFAPRLGFAYSPKVFNDKMVLRGGFGISYNRLPNVLFSNSRDNPPFSSFFSICCGGDFDPYAGGRILYTLGANNSPFSYPVNPALALGIDPATGSARGGAVELYGSFKDVPNSYVYGYSFEGQYDLSHNLVATLGYQGSSGHKLIRLVDQTLIYPFNPAVFFAVFFPQPDVNSNYNALNARLTRRFANGFQLDTTYRFSKSIDTLSYEGPGGETNQTNPGNLASERGPSDFDVKHYLVMSGLYEFPFFRDRRTTMGKILGGFQLSGILTAHSGFPFTPKLFNDLRQPSGRLFGPIRPTGYFGGALNDTSDDAFIRPGGNFPGGGTLYFPTGSGQPGIGRNSFRGPTYFSVDMSVLKEVGLPKWLGLGEGSNLELRANFFNIFNQLNLEPIRYFSPGAIITDPNFGRSERGLAGRIVEFQGRFRF
jgi:hypothetical protein